MIPDAEPRASRAEPTVSSGYRCITMITPRRRLLNRLATTALATLIVTSAAACASIDNATDTNAADTESPATATALSGVQVDVRRDPG